MQLKIYKDQIMCRNNGPATEHVSRIDKSFDFKKLYKIHESHLFDQNMNHTNYILLKKPSLTTFSGILNGGCAPICADISSKKISVHMLATHFLKWNRSHSMTGKRQCNSHKQVWSSRLPLWDEGMCSVGKWSNGACSGPLGTTLARSTTPARSVSPAVLSVAERSSCKCLHRGPFHREIYSDKESSSSPGYSVYLGFVFACHPKQRVLGLQSSVTGHFITLQCKLEVHRHTGL